MKTYRGGGVIPHIYKFGIPVSHYGHLTSREIYPSTHWEGRGLTPGAGLNIVEKSFAPAGNLCLIPWFSSP
jgi:hypothetical protein